MIAIGFTIYADANDGACIPGRPASSANNLYSDYCDDSNRGGSAHNRRFSGTGGDNDPPPIN